MLGPAGARDRTSSGSSPAQPPLPPGKKWKGRAASLLDEAAAGRRDTLGVENTTWKLGKLRQDFANDDMEPKYQRYQQRLQHSQFVVYLLMQTSVSLASVIISLVTLQDDWEHAIRHAVTHAVVSTVTASLMAYVYKEQSFKDRPYLHFLASAIVFVTLESMQAVFLVLRPNEESSLLQDWSFYTVVVCYIFLPLPTKLQASVLGLVVTGAQLILVTVDKNFFDGDHTIERLGADILLLVCANGLGLYYRLMFEIAIRRSFLDKRASIYHTLRLNREKKKEENLLKSILPKHLSEAVRRDLRKQSVGAYFKHHKNVSILFADIVNFTPLTTTMPVSELVSMLDELFGKFDEAAEKNKCLRIKILGDCYYCVCGVPNHIPKHAFLSVTMGLSMITTIREVREKWDVNVDMRIGINSGDVFSGILGKKKWQYDVWGTDVTIANHMEQSGRKGCVHLTQTTRDECGSDLPASLLTKGKQDQYLEDKRVETYLLEANEVTLEHVNRVEVDAKRQWLQTQSVKSKVTRKRSSFYSRATNLTGRVSRQQSTSAQPVRRSQDLPMEAAARQPPPPPPRQPDVTIFSSRRQTAIVDDALEEFRSIRIRVDEYMKEAIEKMPTAKVDQWFNPESLHPLFLTFHEADMEMPFTLQENPTVKFSFVAAMAVILILGVVQVLVIQIDVVSAVSAGCVFLAALLALTAWASDLAAAAWGRDEDGFYGDDASSADLTSQQGGGGDQQQDQLRRGSSRQHRQQFLLLPLSDLVSRAYVASFRLRCVGFLVVAVASCLISSLPMYFCSAVNQDGNYTEENSTSTTTTTTSAPFYDSDSSSDDHSYSWLGRSVRDGYQSTVCPYPRYTAKCFLLALASTFVFYRGHFLLKLATMLVNVLCFSIVAVYQRRDMFFEPRTGTDLVDANLHQLILMVITFHLIDRQTEYLFRLDFVWKQKLSEEKEEAQITNKVNGDLLRNILPHHVAKIYLNTPRHQLEEAGSPPAHHEVYENVAVMFASIPDFYLDAAQGPNNNGSTKNAYAGTEVFAEPVVFQADDKLSLLNKIICLFDELLPDDKDEAGENPFEAVEKIKVTGATYMAAVGLESARKSSQSVLGAGRASVFGPGVGVGVAGAGNGGGGSMMSPLYYRRTRSSEPTAPSRDVYEIGVEEVESKAVENVRTMVHFAVKLQEQLSKFNRDTFQSFELRIGIDVGPLVAGVIGSKKPMYDIWGDTVNMASRLDYTGVPGRIHVTERVFNRLRAARISADFRGPTKIKGKEKEGPIPTYFVDAASLLARVAEDRRLREQQQQQAATVIMPANYGRSMSTLGSGAGKKLLAAVGHNFGLMADRGSGGFDAGASTTTTTTTRDRKSSVTGQQAGGAGRPLMRDLSEYDFISEDYVTPAPAPEQPEPHRQPQHHPGKLANLFHHSHSEGKLQHVQPRTASLPALALPSAAAAAATAASVGSSFASEFRPSTGGLSNIAEAEEEEAEYLDESSQQEHVLEDDEDDPSAEDASDGPQQHQQRLAEPARPRVRRSGVFRHEVPGDVVVEVDHPVLLGPSSGRSSSTASSETRGSGQEDPAASAGGTMRSSEIGDPTADNDEDGAQSDDVSSSSGGSLDYRGVGHEQTLAPRIPSIVVDSYDSDSSSAGAGAAASEPAAHFKPHDEVDSVHSAAIGSDSLSGGQVIQTAPLSSDDPEVMTRRRGDHPPDGDELDAGHPYINYLNGESTGRAMSGDVVDV